jgi:hypothetical protein
LLSRNAGILLFCREGVSSIPVLPVPGEGQCNRRGQSISLAVQWFYEKMSGYGNPRHLEKGNQSMKQSPQRM